MKVFAIIGPENAERVAELMRDPLGFPCEDPPVELCVACDPIDFITGKAHPVALAIPPILDDENRVNLAPFAKGYRVEM